MTVSGTTTSTSSKDVKQSGSAISTDVSSTTRARCVDGRPDVAVDGRIGAPVRPLTGTASDTGRRSVTATPCRGWRVGRRIVGGRSCATGCSARRPSWWMHANRSGGRRPYSGGCGRPCCAFCSIVAGTTPADVVRRDDVVVAFLDRVAAVPRARARGAASPRGDASPSSIRNWSGRSSSAVQAVAAAMPDALGAQGTFVAHQQRREPERAAPPRARRAADARATGCVASSGRGRSTPPVRRRRGRAAARAAHPPRADRFERCTQVHARSCKCNIIGACVSRMMRMTLSALRAFRGARAPTVRHRHTGQWSSVDQLERGPMTKAELIDAWRSPRACPRRTPSAPSVRSSTTSSTASQEGRQGRVARLRIVQHVQASGPHRPQPADRRTGEDRRVDRAEVLAERHRSSPRSTPRGRR